MQLLQSQASHFTTVVSQILADDCAAWHSLDTELSEISGVEHEVFIYAIAGVGLAIGLFECFCGYKFWRATIFILGGYLCAVVAYSLVHTYWVDASPYHPYCVGLLAWLLGGLFFSLFWKLATVAIGAAMGVLGALFLQPLLLAYIWEDEPNAVLYIMMVVLGTLGGVLALYKQRPTVIISTSFYGAFLFIVSLSTYAGGMPTFGSAQFEELASEGIGCVPGYAWGYAGGLVALWLLGLGAQFTITAKGVDHGFPPKWAEDEQGLVASEHKPVQYV